VANESILAEGIAPAAVGVRTVAASGLAAWVKRHAPGLALVLAMAAAAFLLGRLVPVIGGPVIGIVMGMVVQNHRRSRADTIENAAK
jgi:uncharacterized membrane protein YadS